MYDGRYIIMVKVNYDSTQLEDNFRLTLLDSTNKPLTKWKYSNTNEKAVLWKNPPAGSVRNREKPQSEHFPFVKNNFYIFTDPAYPYYSSPLNIQVEYLGKPAKKKNKVQTFTLPKNAISHLCNAKAIWYGKVDAIPLDFK